MIEFLRLVTVCHKSLVFKVQCLKTASTVALLSALLKNAHKHGPSSTVALLKVMRELMNFVADA